MEWLYFDASALIKRYSSETGTPLVNEAFRRVPLSRMTCSLLSILEIVSILVRKRNDGRLDQSVFEQAMVEFEAEVIDREEFSATPVNDGLLLSAVELITRHNLNAADAIILRSALDLRQVLHERKDDLTLWASDKRLVRAAKSEGMSVFDPEETATL
ncbi:MAG: type II toxin-antitoxin system VapC family toxin [Thermoflexales bacterium]|nr:type II toxin-antitoxin system VapC family toxin [Thermoflexales bacterium]